MYRILKIKNDARYVSCEYNQKPNELNEQQTYFTTLQALNGNLIPATLPKEKEEFTDQGHQRTEYIISLALSGWINSYRGSPFNFATEWTIASILCRSGLKIVSVRPVIAYFVLYRLNVERKPGFLESKISWRSLSESNVLKWFINFLILLSTVTHLKVFNCIVKCDA